MMGKSRARLSLSITDEALELGLKRLRRALLQGPGYSQKPKGLVLN